MKLSEFSSTATESPPIKDEIAALEHQISYHRARIKSRSHAVEYQARKRITSPAFLLLAAGAGFLGERYLSSKSAKQAAQSKPNGHAREPAHESIIEKGLKLVTLIQGIMASYPVMLLRKHLDEQKRQAPPQSKQTSSTQTPDKQTPSPGDDAHYYH